MGTPTKTRWTSYFEPYEPLAEAAWALRVTIIESFRAQGFRAIWGLTEWRDAAFALWYKTLNQHFVRFESRTAIPGLVAKASGLVLDLGPALGNQLSRFDQDKITQIYGIEKNTHFVPDLELEIKKTELQQKYTLVSCGIEDTDILERHGITDGSVDTILCIQVLCSVSNPEAVARGLYKLLRPGGTFIFWEHHANHDFVTRIVQRFWNPAWRYAIGGCSMNRDMLSILRNAGDWENFDSIEGDEQPSSLLPRIWGTLIKRSEAH